MTSLSDSELVEAAPWLWVGWTSRWRLWVRSAKEIGLAVWATGPASFFATCSSRPRSSLVMLDFGQNRRMSERLAAELRRHAVRHGVVVVSADGSDG